MESDQKLYYDIAAVSKMLGCAESKLRYWEDHFPQLNPKRDARNRRRYTDKDIEVIRKIMHQKDKQGRTNKGAREQLRRKEDAQKMIYKLSRVRQFLSVLQEAL